MYANFSYEIVSGTDPEGEVLDQIVEAIGLMPNTSERRRCQLLSDTFICQIADGEDFTETHKRIARLRTNLGGKFNYTFSLHRRNDLIEVRGEHNAALRKQIVEA